MLAVVRLNRSTPFNVLVVSRNCLKKCGLTLNKMLPEYRDLFKDE